MIVPTTNDKCVINSTEGNDSLDSNPESPSLKRKNSPVSISRRLVFGGLLVGATYLFTRDRNAFSPAAEASLPLPRRTTPITPAVSPFTHYAGREQITVLAGEPVICDVETILNPAFTSISYTHGYTVSVTALRSGNAVPYVPDDNSYQYRGHIIGRRLYYTINRVFDLTKPGTYQVDFHLDMPWKIPSTEDIEAQQEYHESLKAWSAVGPKGQNPIPKFPESNAPASPHQATVSVQVRVLPSSTMGLKQSARQRAQQLCQSLVDYDIAKSTVETQPVIEAFWSYPDSVLLPIANEELVPFKKLLARVASEPCPPGTELSRTALNARLAIRAFIFRMYCPPLSEQRRSFLRWLTEDIRSGKNDALRYHLERDLNELL